MHPPPSYYETEGCKDCKPPPEEAPPEYEEAVSMLAGQGGRGGSERPSPEEEVIDNQSHLISIQELIIVNG